MHDPFQHFFGMGHPQGKKNKGDDMQGQVTVSLNDLYTGIVKKVKVKRNEVCRACMGTGAKDGRVKTCNHCHGKGVTMRVVQMGHAMMQMQEHCRFCRGKGRIQAENCPACNGHKTHRRETELEAIVEKGMKDEDKIVFEMEQIRIPISYREMLY